MSASASGPGTAARRRRWPRALALSLAALAVAGAAGFGFLHARLRASLPQLEGERTLPGLVAPVRIERDALGVPVVRGASRLDVARATGFLHAQERFFQMDLLRRRSAGELAELVGKLALPSDREVRVLRLRAVARRALGRLPQDERALLVAYSEGVAAGLAALGAPPFEYSLLRQQPAPWRPEDTLLCSLTMYLTLQDALPQQESTLGVMHDVLPQALFDFLTPRGTTWDAPLEGEAFPQPKIPGPEVLDLWRGPTSPDSGEPVASDARPDPDAIRDGSNNWALAGAHTADGAALVANDMHLGLSLPNIWYRVSLVVTGGARVTGVTLPGAPFVIVGSNGRVAWGFTNSEGDWVDLVVLEPDAGDPEAYRTPHGPRRFEHTSEVVHVAGSDDVQLDTLQTIWGPVIDKDHAGRRRALAWVALRDGGLDASLVRLEEAANVAEALRIAAAAGIPEQNFVVGDAAGHVGWTIAGRIPRRFGHDGRLPTSWADGARGWDGWLPVAEAPRVVDPPGGRLWTANARVVTGEKLRLVGFGGYDLGARQGQIRDNLRALGTASEADMLRIQLDDRALFLARWQRLLLELLTPERTAVDPRREEARRLVAAWGGRAAVESVGYRIVRAFRNRVADEVLVPLVAPCRAADPSFDYLGRVEHKKAYGQWEGPLWALLSARPKHLLSPRFESWDALLVRALDAVLDELTEHGARLAQRTWGERNTSRDRHPLSPAVPGLGRLVDMPPLQLPGDSHMPRFQSPSAGASERFAVSPGHEERGYFHMPGGESGHPLSAHYRDGHEAWANGRATPFLPGPAVHVLSLAPAGARGAAGEGAAR
jgi:penicillin G amidase